MTAFFIMFGYLPLRFCCAPDRFFLFVYGAQHAGAMTRWFFRSVEKVPKAGYFAEHLPRTVSSNAGLSLLGVNNCFRDATAGSSSLGSGKCFTWVLAGDAVFGVRQDDSGGGGRDPHRRRSFFKRNDDVDNINDGEHDRLLSHDKQEAPSSAGRQGKGGAQEEWFDIGMSFCSEMELPMRDDVDAEIVSEAQRMLKEEGR